MRLGQPVDGVADAAAEFRVLGGRGRGRPGRNRGGVVAAGVERRKQVTLCELVASEDTLRPDIQLTMYHSAEVELGETTRAVLDQVERVRPRRVVIDSLSELRLPAQSPLRYRRQILTLKQFFAGRQSTILLLDDRTSELNDLQLQSISHGVISLEHLAPEFGAERRRLRVIKLRGRRFRGGYHDFQILRGGLRVYPRLIAAEHHAEFPQEDLACGVGALDALLGGGLRRGTSTLFLGPAGTGKSTVALRFLTAAAERGDHGAAFLFDEGRATLLHRSLARGMDVAPHIRSGRLTFQQVDPAERTPGESSHTIRRAVEAEGARVVMIDRLNGYLQAMPEERFLIIQLHEILTYLAQKGVVTLLVVAQHGLVGAGMTNTVDASYLADTVVLLRHFETAGELRKAISVLKERSGGHEKSIRELRLGPEGIRVGEPLDRFRGVFTGIPTFTGDPDDLLGRNDERR